MFEVCVMWVPLQVTGYLMMGALTPNCKKHSGRAAQ